jgi:hypothetical protein
MAEECLKLARQADSPDQRLLLLDMAQAWLTLATNTEMLTGARPSPGSEA